MYKNILTSLTALCMLSTVFLMGLSFNIKPVKADWTWTETIYIRADGSVIPDTAPISSADNITYTLTDNIVGYVPEDTSAIVVERDSVVVDGAGYTIQGAREGYSKGIDLSSRNNVTVKKVVVTEFHIGIYLDHSVNCALTSTTASNIGAGIVLESSSNSVIAANVASNITFGIYLGSSHNNTLTSNNFSSTSDAGIRMDLSNHNTLASNNLSNCRFGILLLSSSNNTLTYNIVSSNRFEGIHFTYGSGNFLAFNTASSNNGEGIYFYALNNNTLIGNIASSNGKDGIHLLSSCNNTLIGNIASSNSLCGIHLTAYEDDHLVFSGSRNNTLVDNIASNNKHGIRFSDSYCKGNVLTGNTFSSNNQTGLYMYTCDNALFHNNLINNTLQAFTSGCVNIWDNGFPSGGNYWSDYEDRHPDAEEIDESGIWDTPYVIDEDNQDNYPLMNAWGDVEPPVADAGPDLTVDAGTTVTFNGSKSVDDMAIKSYAWTFTDIALQTLTGVHPTYTFNNIGGFEVTLNVSDHAGNWNTDTVTITVQLPQHELVASITAPASMQLGRSSSLNATVTNEGLSDEANVELMLLINGTTVNSTTIPLLQTGNSHTLSYLWAPVTEGTYNVTVYAHPVPGETLVENNQMSKFVTVSAIAPEVQVGFKAGDWIKCDYTVTGWPSGTPYPEWLKVEIQSVEGATATAEVTMHMSDGTEQSDSVSVDVVTGGETFDTLFGFVIPANCSTGDSITIGGNGLMFNVTMDGETTRTYAGASRTVVYASFSQYGTQLTYYWDKQTGVMVEASTTSGAMTATAKATETNMWQAQPYGLPIDPTLFYGLIIVAIVIVAAVAFFMIRRRKKLPEEIKSP